MARSRLIGPADLDINHSAISDGRPTLRQARDHSKGGLIVNALVRRRGYISRAATAAP